MIDGHIKHRIDAIWDRLARLPIALGISANQITLLGCLLMLGVSISYPYWQNPMGFGIAILIIFAFDSLDGAVARMTNTQSSFGGYLDAIIDRYQELFVCAALAYTHDLWIEAFILLSGSYLVSYTKARTAIEHPIDNVAWPDLMERLERVLALCAGLIAAPFIPWPESWSFSYLSTLLLTIGLLTHATAIQRFYRAKKLLTHNERE